MSTVELDDQLVQAAIEATAAGFGETPIWLGLPTTTCEAVAKFVHGAIAHYLANRTLPQQMRESASVLEQAREEFHSRPENADRVWLAISWRPSDLRQYADQWEADAAARAKLDAQVEELAKALHQALLDADYTIGPDWDKCIESYQKMLRAEARGLLKTYTITRREA
ncbi:MAG: hypothetical protein E6R06_21845 [Mycobacterium sp.]|nr:MAG: hypothetical protein E6R06_21845 [Mycobacterium sp.]